LFFGLEGLGTNRTEQCQKQLQREQAKRQRNERELPAPSIVGVVVWVKDEHVFIDDFDDVPMTCAAALGFVDRANTEVEEK
jgi:hypothetical protein